MSARIPVVVEVAAYRAATAGLPSQAELVDRAAGSIVVVDGTTEWWEAAAVAVDAGASAVLVAEPLEVPAAAVRELAGRAEVPIVVHRSRLRGDLVAVALEHRGGVAPRVVVADCRAAAAQFPLLVRDAVGWLVAFAGAPLTVASAPTPVSSGGSALLRSGGTGIHCSMIMTASPLEGMMLRVQALGETITELEIDEPVGRTELATSTSRGRLIAPQRFESPERYALRRAIEAVVHGTAVSDLDRLLHDSEIAASVLLPAG